MTRAAFVAKSQQVINRKHKALDLYLNEIKNLEPFTPEEEVDLARRSKAGDKAAYRDLITHNLRFVVAVAKRFQYHGIPLEDLINEGNLGLIRAVEKYDETRGFRFITYAVWWISQSIRQAIAKTGRTVRLPNNVTESMGSLYKQSLELEKEIEREPTPEELASINRCDIKEIENLLQQYYIPTSLDDPVNSSSSMTMIDSIKIDDERPESRIMAESLHSEIVEVLHTLSRREEFVIIRYFGIGTKRQNLDEIGDELNISRERVRQIKEKALARLRHATRSHLLRLYLS